jgi:hypothetical protein
MPRGGKRPGAGRPKGSPNKVTAEAREAFRMVYEGRLTDLDRWIRETGDGFEAIKIVVVDKAVEKVPYLEKDPGKAADLLTRMAEHFVPKLQRLEKTIADASDEELLAEVRRRAAEAPKP